jgi:hypothetical protein
MQGEPPKACFPFSRYNQIEFPVNIMMGCRINADAAATESGGSMMVFKKKAL